MKSLKYKQPESNKQILIASEPEVLYARATKDINFSIDTFENLQQNIPFSQIEWADILHINTRTLQRYIKDNKAFEGLYAEHLHQILNMSKLGLSIFKTSDILKEWLITPKHVLGNTLDFNSLKSFWGVKLISNELGRITYGVYI